MAESSKLGEGVPRSSSKYSLTGGDIVVPGIELQPLNNTESGTRPTMENPDQLRRARKTPPSTNQTALGQTAGVTSIEQSALSMGQCEDSTPSPDSRSRRVVGTNITLDRILAKETCPPVDRDSFVHYCRDVEVCAESPLFVLWHTDYTHRFENASPAVKAKAPEWTDAMKMTARKQIQRRSSMISGNLIVGVPQGFFSEHSDGNGTSMRVAEGLPFADEIDRILEAYIADGPSERTLNISSRDRNMIELAIQKTTHPSAFLDAVNIIKADLARQVLPRFLAAAVSNANPERQQVARWIGIGLIGLGVIALLLLCLSSIHRGWRALPSLLIVPGVATFYCAQKGMCIILHGLGRIQTKPWNLFVDEEEPRMNTVADFLTSFSLEAKPWVKRYKAVTWIRRVIGKEDKIEELGIRKLQNKEAALALGWGIAVSLLLLIFVFAAPVGGFF